MNSSVPTFSSTAEIKVELDKIPKTGLSLFADGKIYTHSLLLLGLLNRTYELTESAMWAVNNDRPQTAANMLRALYETLGFTYYVKEQITSSPNNEERGKRIATLLMGSRAGGNGFQSVNILTCLDKAVKTFPLLRKNYDDLSEIVHPNSSSHFYAGKTTDKTDSECRNVEFRVPFYEFKNEDKKNITNQVGECCYHIRSLCEEIVSFLKS